MKVKITFTDEILGTASADSEIHKEFIASKSADKAKVKEELEALPADDLIEKAITVFSRAKDGRPMFWDYQWRGFFKEVLGSMVEFSPLVLKVGRKEIKFSKWTYKRLVDNYIFVTPREIPLNMPAETKLGECTRPLRAETQKGPRVALATSETVPEKTTCEFEVKSMRPELDALIVECLDYGIHKGMGQWRNSGKGRFTWEEIS
jgi:hypothetical protein